MKYKITAGCELSLDQMDLGLGKLTVDTASLFLELDKSWDESKYINDNGTPTVKGTKTITNILIQGLVANIHGAHQTKQWDSAEHLRYIISELERGFVQIGDIDQSI